MNGDSSEGNIYFVYFHSVNVKGNWTYSEEKNLRPGAKITTTFKLSLKYFNRFIMKTFQKCLFCFEHQNHVIRLLIFLVLS